MHDLLVDELIWVADSSGDGGGNPAEVDVVDWLLPSDNCAKEFGKSI